MKLLDVKTRADGAEVKLSFADGEKRRSIVLESRDAYLVAGEILAAVVAANLSAIARRSGTRFEDVPPVMTVADVNASSYRGHDQHAFRAVELTDESGFRLIAKLTPPMAKLLATYLSGGTLPPVTQGH